MTNYSSSYLIPSTHYERPLRRSKLILSFRRRSVGARGIKPRVIGALISWALLIFVVCAAISPYTSTHSTLTFERHSNPSPIQATLIAQIPTLPGGPIGSLLPPGTMSPAFTFRNSYVPGQCTSYVAGRRPIPSHWGDAVSWFSHARNEGWQVGTAPAIAAIAWTPAGRYGHVALVEAIDGGQVLISEMNYLGPGKIDKRWLPTSSFKYIY